MNMKDYPVDFSLDFTKFFDVKSPLGHSQKETADCPYQSIGVDLYMPRPTMKFVEALIDSNKSRKLELINYIFNDEGTLLKKFQIINQSNEIVISFDNNVYFILGRIQIPTGVGILIPDDYWANLRSKSSNFQNNYTVVHGTIDEDYTYGMGIQIIPLSNDVLKFAVDEKIAQIVLIKSSKIYAMNEISQDDWNNNDNVKSRRLSRLGGFGHTGKFDK